LILLVSSCSRNKGNAYSLLNNIHTNLNNEEQPGIASLLTFFLSIPERNEAGGSDRNRLQSIRNDISYPSTFWKISRGWGAYHLTRAHVRCSGWKEEDRHCSALLVICNRWKTSIVDVDRTSDSVYTKKSFNNLSLHHVVLGPRDVPLQDCP
jgi:hypothetical protein